MGRKIGFTVSVIGAILLSWSGLQADKVIDTKLQSAHDIVATRKFVMKLLVENLQDMGKKFSGPNAGDGSVNAGNMQAFAEVLPPLFRAEFKEVYADFKDSSYFFKGAPASGIEAEAEKLRSAAMALRQGLMGSDPEQAKKDMDPVTETCKGCHAQYRGKK
jgi:cytochrome c556